MLFLPNSSRGISSDHKDQPRWLDAKYSFNFGSFVDNDDGFSHLRVLNEDIIAPGHGFDSHGHSDFEIFTIVLSGILRHADSVGNITICNRGSVQFTSAGTGITHSEYNASNDDFLHLLQVWIKPSTLGLEPSYCLSNFDEWANSNTGGKFLLILSPDGRNGSILVNADVNVCLYAGSDAVSYQFGRNRCGYVHVITGQATAGVNDTYLSTGDAMKINTEENFTFSLDPKSAYAEVILFDMSCEDNSWEKMDVTEKFAAFVNAHEAQRRALVQNL